MDTKATITIKTEDQSSEAAKKVTRAYDELNDQIARLIQQERANKVMQDAQKAFEGMTDAEKDALIATRQLKEEQEELAEATKKATEKASKEAAENAKKAQESLISGMKDVGTAATIGLTVPLVAAGAASVKAVSDLNEAINATQVTFRDASSTIMQFSETAATSMGLSQRAFLQAATPLGASLQNLGLNAQEAAEWTIKLSSRASDMASVFNTDVNDALSAISSLIRGERNPIERYGVGINDAAIKAYALAHGLGSATGEMDMQQKAMVSLTMMMDQTNKVSGDFINTSDGLANSARIAKAQLEESAVAIGNKLLPVASAGVNAIADFTTAFAELDPAMQGAAVSLGAITAGIGPMLTGVSTAITSYGQLEKAVTTAGLSMKAVAVTAGAIAAAVVAATAAGAKFVEFEKMQEEGAKNVSDSWDKMFASVIDGGGDAQAVLDAYGRKQEQVNDIMDKTNVIMRWQIQSRTNSIDTEEKLLTAISRGSKGYTEYREAIRNAQAQGYLLDLTEQQIEAQFYRTRDATAHYRTAVQEMTLTNSESLNVQQEMIEHSQRIAQARDEEAAAAKRSEEATASMFSSVDMNLSGTIQRTLEKIKYLDEGGYELQQQFEEAYTALMKDPGDPIARLRVEKIYDKAKKLEDTLAADVEQARSVAEANQEMFESLDTGLDRSIQNALDKVAFLEAGGGDLQKAFDDAYESLVKDPGDPAAKKRMEDLYVQAQVLQIILGDLNARDAAKNISEQLGIPLEDAKKKLKEVEDSLRNLDGSITKAYLDIEVRMKTPYGTTGGTNVPVPGSEHIPIQYGGTLDTGVDENGDYTGTSAGGFRYSGGAGSTSTEGTQSVNVAAINIYQQPGENAQALANRVSRELNQRSRNAYNAGAATAGVG